MGSINIKLDTDGRAYAGDHLLVELWGSEFPNDVAYIEKTLVTAARAAGATVLSKKIHRFGEGGGITGVVILAESHISIHSWPELSYIAIDVFMCGESDPTKTLPVFLKYFSPTRMETQLIKRGALNSDD